MVGASNSPSEEGLRDGAAAAQELIGVVIVNFYTAAYLQRCLKALDQQTRPADAIVVINNGDRPGALDFISLEYPTVRIIDQNNVGFAAANNLAISELQGYEWIALLNPDAFPEPAWLEQLLAAAVAHPDMQVFSSLLLLADDPTILDGDGDLYHISGLAWRSNHGRSVADAQDTREVFSACAAAALYRREALIAVQGFDPRYFCYFEDVDLGFRLRLRGYRCLQVATARVHHVGGGSTGGQKLSSFALYHGHRNLVWTFVKNMPGWWFWLLLPAHILLNMLEIVWFACKGYGGVICRAKWDALRAIPTVWRQRKIIQAERAARSWPVLKLMSCWPLTWDK